MDGILGLVLLVIMAPALIFQNIIERIWGKEHYLAEGALGEMPKFLLIGSMLWLGVFLLAGLGVRWLIF